MNGTTAGHVAPPLALIAELTHRCPLQWPYCANPLLLEPASTEMDTNCWIRVLDEAAALGVLHLHLSGGEPLLRRDLPELVRRAAANGLYTNLITSGIPLDARLLEALVASGLDHVQLSFQDAEPGCGDRLGGYRGGHRRKLAAAHLIAAAQLPLTVNFVVHRQNLDRLPEMLALGEAVHANRIEVAHVQYHGWALANRDSLMPSREQLDRATSLVEAARAALRGGITINYVAPDYHAQEPKPCMSGWGQRVINVTPSGLALPCHAAETLPGFRFASVREHALSAIWQEDAAFRRFRRTAWMPEPCRSCDRKEVDWGGCRCQAFALIGDPAATDPVCALSPAHDLVKQALERSRDTGLIPVVSGSDLFASADDPGITG